MNAVLRFFKIIIIPVLLVTISGCTVVHAPAKIVRPTTVYLTDEVVHSSLVLPTEDGRYVEYAPGDWTYAALNERDIFHAMGALCFSNQAALGRRYLKFDPKCPSATAELKGYTIKPIVVDQAKVTELLAKLAARFHDGKMPRINRDDHFLWVEVEGNYSIGHNCNTLAKESLDLLGCKVDSGSVFAMYDVKPAGK